MVQKRFQKQKSAPKSRPGPILPALHKVLSRVSRASNVVSGRWVASERCVLSVSHAPVEALDWHTGVGGSRDLFVSVA
jgi:hypothetical protein